MSRVWRHRYASLQDRVDYHGWDLAKAAGLSTVLSVGAELATNDDDRLIQAIRNGGQDTINEAGQLIIRRQLNVAPTLTIDSAFPMRVTFHAERQPPMLERHAKFSLACARLHKDRRRVRRFRACLESCISPDDAARNAALYAIDIGSNQTIHRNGFHSGKQLTEYFSRVGDHRRAHHVDAQAARQLDCR